MKKSLAAAEKKAKAAEDRAAGGITSKKERAIEKKKKSRKGALRTGDDRDKEKKTKRKSGRARSELVTPRAEDQDLALPETKRKGTAGAHPVIRVPRRRRRSTRPGREKEDHRLPSVRASSGTKAVALLMSLTPKSEAVTLTGDHLGPPKWKGSRGGRRLTHLMSRIFARPLLRTWRQTSFD